MTALAKDFKGLQQGTPDQPSPTLLSFPVAAETTIYAGGIVCTNASGYAVPASASTSLKVWGRAKRQVVNTTANGFGSAADLYVYVERGSFAYGGSGFTIADVGKLCYVTDDNNVSLTDSSGTKPLAGVIMAFVSSTKVFVLLGGLTLLGGEIGLGGGGFTARGVGPTSNVSNLTAFTVASNDGVTYVAGDTVVLYAQTSAIENGPYLVGAVDAGTAPLTRPSWWPTGATVKSGTQLQLGGEGTLFSNTRWKVCAASAAIVVGTDSAALFPAFVAQRVTLNSGTSSITNVPILSATKSTAMISLITATTATSTMLYTASAFTASTTGNGTVAIHARTNGATESTLDGSALNVGICNW